MIRIGETNDMSGLVSIENVRSVLNILEVGGIKDRLWNGGGENENPEDSRGSVDWCKRRSFGEQSGEGDGISSVDKVKGGARSLGDLLKAASNP